MRKRRESGGLESEVLATLWAAEVPLTAAQVAEGLGTDLAYTTVQTILARLHDKGAVRRELAGRAHAYTPVLDESGLAAERMRAILDRENDAGAVLSHFIEILTPAEETTLARLLGNSRHKGPTP